MSTPHETRNNDRPGSLASHDWMAFAHSRRLPFVALARGPDDEGPGHHQSSDPVRRPVRSPGYAVALGDAADHQRVSAEDDAGELRLHRQVSALRLQLDRLEPLPPDEGVLPRRLRQRSRSMSPTGRWFPAGSSVEEGDVNLPSAEGIFRQILYGNDYYRKDFGKASTEFMLPDCFGFPASLPSILAHAGLKGFSTQKLSAAWQPAPKVGGPDSPEQTPEGHSVQRRHSGSARMERASSRH